MYVPNDDYFVSVRLKRTNRKIGKIVNLYQREVFKKIPRLSTFFIQSVNEGLSNSEQIYWNTLLHNSYQLKRLHA